MFHEGAVKGEELLHLLMQNILDILLLRVRMSQDVIQRDNDTAL